MSIFLIGLLGAAVLMAASMIIKSRALRQFNDRALTEDAVRAHLATLPPEAQVALAAKLATASAERGKLRDTLNPPTEAETNGFRLSNRLSTVGLVVLLGMWVAALVFGG